MMLLRFVIAFIAITVIGGMLGTLGPVEILLIALVALAIAVVPTMRRRRTAGATR